MKREVVQDFLNLPGIAGFALMSGRSRPYFSGIDQMLNFQQREALAQGIQQVIETTPASFQFFEFQFNGHQVYIYKLNSSMILLVFTGGNVVHATYHETVDRLRQELQAEDASMAGAVTTFRLLSGVATGQNSWKQTASQPKTTDAPSALPPPAADPAIDSRELLAAVNHLSQFATQYLGTTVVVNYWKTTRPTVEWLDHLQFDRTAHISFARNAPASLTVEQQQWLQAWSAAFIERCSKVIRDFPKLVRQNALTEQQKTLLLSKLP